MNQIANLRGLPEEGTRELYWQDRGTTYFGAALNNVLAKYQIGTSKAQDRIIENWREIAGEKFFQKCRPERITQQNYLVIVASNSIIRQELQFQQRKILVALSHIPECKHINKLVIKV